jgi:hypothetical protein
MRVDAKHQNEKKKKERNLLVSGAAMNRKEINQKIYKHICINNIEEDLWI